MSGIGRGLAVGVAAGAAGSTALNGVTYLDMVLRGRPSSGTPETTATKLAEATGVTIPGNDEQREARTSGLGPLLGLGTGIAVGALLGVARASGWSPGRTVGILATSGAILVAANAPMTLLRVTDPRTWSVTDWISDIIPHVAYGAATYLTVDSAIPART